MRWLNSTLAKKGLPLLLDLIYFSNQIRIEESDVLSVGVPRRIDQRLDLTDDPDTFVELDLSQITDYRMNRVEGFMYRRIHATELGILSLGSGYQFPFTTHSIIAQLNADYGLNLSPEDVVYKEYLMMVDTVTLEFSSSSLNYSGKVEIKTADLLFGKAYLDGFYEWVA